MIATQERNQSTVDGPIKIKIKNKIKQDNDTKEDTRVIMSIGMEEKKSTKVSKYWRESETNVLPLDRNRTVRGGKMWN